MKKPLLRLGLYRVKSRFDSSENDRAAADYDLAAFLMPHRLEQERQNQSLVAALVSLMVADGGILLGRRRRRG